MQIRTNNGAFEIKIKDLKVDLGEGLKIGEFNISSPGEFEVSGVFAQVLDGIYYLEAEGVSIGFLSVLRTFSDQEKEIMSGVDILIIPNKQGFDPKKLAFLVGEIDPKVILSSGSQESNQLQSFLKTETANPEVMDKLLINKNNLPSEETRRVVVLKE